MKFQGFLRINIESRDELYRCYLPFLKNGGFFFPCSPDKLKTYTLGKEVFLEINLMLSKDERRRMGGKGKVAWINPTGLLRKPAGIGIELSADAGESTGLIENITKGKIESILGAKLNAQALTYTM